MRYLVTSDSTLTANQLITIYQKRWKVEEYHRSLKQNASLAKSPTRTPTTQTNHFVTALWTFTACLLAANIQVSMDGRGRALDNVFCERLWRSVKYENIYLNQYDTVHQLHAGLTAYFDFYNHERPHQSLNYRTPAEEHFVLCSEPAAFA